MKILYDYQTFYDQEYGGVSRYFIELYKEFIKTDDVKICCPYSNNYYLENELGIKRIKKKKSTIFSRIIWKYYYEKRNAKESIKIAKKSDIVHSTWNRPYINKVNKNFVVTIHDMIHEIYWKDIAIKEIKNKKRAIYDSKAIIAISENTKKDIMKFYPDIDENKIKVIYHGTNHLPKAEKPTQSQLPSKYLLYVGRRDSYKGANFMIDSLADYLKQKKDIYLVFASGSPFSKEEIDYFNKLGIIDLIKWFKPKDSELAYLYQNAICFIYPSEYEGFGVPLLEAFDNNCPVVCTNSSSLPEVGGDAALYFSLGNKEELVSKVDCLVSNPHIREQQIIKGLERTKLFTWEKSVENTRKLYLSVLNNDK